MKDWIRKLLGKKETGSNVIPLTLEEKRDLRDEFWRFMDANPLPAPRANFFSTSKLGGPWFTYAPQLAVIVLLISAGSVSYVAEGAGPRDEVLYAVKRNVNEGLLKGISSFSPDLRAEVDKALLSRRFEEIEELIVDKALMEDDAVRLRTDIIAHTTALNEYISEAEAEGEFEAALDTSVDLATVLDAHNTVVYLLDNLEENYSEEQIDSFVREIEGERKTLSQRRQALAERSALTTTMEHEAVITELLKKLEEANSDFDEVKVVYADLDLDAREEIEFLLEYSEKASAEAEEELKAGNTNAAIKKLESAVQNLEKALIILLFYSEATKINGKV